MKKPHHKAKILLLDIETAPLEVYVWSLWKQNVGLNQIITEWTALSFSAKWLGAKRIIYKDNRHSPDPRDDRAIMQEVWHLINEADVIIAQNGVKFDLRKLNARFVLLGMGPPSPYKVVDTMLASRKHFGFTSNRLAWLSEKLTDIPKSVHPEFPGFELWLGCLAGNIRAWKCMEKYNKVDVLSMEQVYLKIRPWIEGHPNLAIYGDDLEVPACPKCASTDLTCVPKTYKTQTQEYPMYHCNSCGGWSRGRFTVASKEKRSNQLVN